MPSISDVQAFWDRQPLFTGESSLQPGSREFFDEHRRVYYADVFAGRMDERIFPNSLHDGAVLDLGCGIGFWLVELSQRGARDLTGADLSPRSLELAGKRCALFDIPAKLTTANAENLPFESGSFSHVNCQGVVHHTPSPASAVREIARVLRPGGTATISVYYKNIILRQWPTLRKLAKFATIGLKGRGRENLSSLQDADEIVRLYDGKDNPIGISYNQDEFKELLSPFEIESVYFHFFPARSLPVGIPKALHRTLDRALPFMIFANVRKV